MKALSQLQGCREGFARHTFIVRETHIPKIHDAAWCHVNGADSVIDVLDDALTEYFERHKKSIKPRQARRA